MEMRKVILFAVFLALVGGIFAFQQFSIVIFACFAIVSATAFSLYLGGLDKESVDGLYYVMGSFGVVLVAFANPFSLDELYDRTAARDYQLRVKMMEEMARFPIRPISYSEHRAGIVRQLDGYFRDADFSTIVGTKLCGDIDDGGLCDERNANSLLAAKAKDFEEFVSYRPFHIRDEGLWGKFGEFSNVAVFSSNSFSYDFDSSFPAKDVFVLLVTADENEPSFDRIIERADKYLDDERKRLDYFKKKVDEHSDYGVPNNWKLLSKFLWPYVLLIALATKLARKAKKTKNVFHRWKDGSKTPTS